MTAAARAGDRRVALAARELGASWRCSRLPAWSSASLWPTNTWDLPTYAGVIGGALAVREFWRRRRVDLAMLVAVAWRLAVVLVVGYVAFLPFHQSNVVRVLGDRAVARVADSARRLSADARAVPVRHHDVSVAGGRATGEDTTSALRLMRLHVTAWGESQRAWPSAPAAWSTRARSAPPRYSVTRFALFALAWLALLDRRSHRARVDPAGAGACCCWLSPAPEPRRQFVLLLIALGLALTIAVEVIVLKGDISRMNTVFKFYLQVWVLWGVAAAAALPIIAERLRSEPEAETAAALAAAAADAEARSETVATDSQRRTARSAVRPPPTGPIPCDGTQAGGGPPSP